MNRATRRRLASNKKGGTQKNHQTYGLKLHAEQLEEQHNKKIREKNET